MSELKGDYRKFMDKNFLGSWDIPDGEDLILTIDHAARDEVKNERGTETKLTLHFKESGYKPMICNVTNAKAISKAHGSTKVEEWKGKRISLYKTAVSAFGSVTDGIRVRDTAPKVEEAYCSKCGSIIEAHGSFTVNKIVLMSEAKYGRRLCWECAQATKALQEGSDGDE